MTHRERWLAAMHYQAVDHVPDQEFGYWDDTLRRWHAEGLPAEITDNGKADRYFGFAPFHGAPPDLGIHPGFASQVLEEDERHLVIIDGAGVKCMINKDGSSSIPKYLEFPIHDHESWDDFAKRLDPRDPIRYPDNWEELKARYAQRDYPLAASGGSLFGWLRNWMGFENIAIACCEDPAWVEEMIEHLCVFITTALERAVSEVQFDAASFWEDMCYKGGPLISPRMFAQWMVPRYQRITDLLHRHGVDVCYVDCDGNINQLVGLWLEGGINCMFPLEIRGGSDPYPMREQYGRQVLLMGGVDKTQLMGDREMIRREVARIKPLVEEGGYIPHVDHRVPPDVSFENYLYYLEVKRDELGIPTPAPYQLRQARS